jgi:integrase
MGKKNIPFTELGIVLRDFNGDLKKRWYIEYYENGTRQRAYKSINRYNSLEERKSVAQSAMAGIAIQLQKSKEESLMDSNKVKISEALQKALDFLNVGKKKKTKQSRQSNLNSFIQFCNQRKIRYINEVTVEVARSFVVQIAQKRANATINGYIERLSAMFAGHSSHNPFAAIKTFVNDCEPTPTFTKEQSERLAAHIAESDPQLWLFVRLLHNCLIRPNSELRLVQVKDIDFERHRIAIPASISKNRTYMKVVVPDCMWSEIEKFKSFPSHYYIFSAKQRPDEKQTGYNYFYNRHRKCLETCGLFGDGLTLYSWKPQGTMAMAEQNIPRIEIQRQGRWKDGKQLDTYLATYGVDHMTHMQGFQGL